MRLEGFFEISLEVEATTESVADRPLVVNDVTRELRMENFLSRKLMAVVV
jgi:hypothetical protein